MFLDQFGKFPLHTLRKFVMITSRYFIALKETFVKEIKVFSIQTPRLLLKELTVTDAEPLFRYRSLPEVMQFQGWAPSSVADAIRFVEEEISHVLNQPDTWFQLGIFRSEEETLIGDMGIHFLTEESNNASGHTNDELSEVVEIGITIAPGFQGNGFATEAIRSMLDFLFGTLHKTKVVASVDPDNQKSMALLEGLGFRLEGIYKNAVLFRGAWVDDAVFEMTDKKWAESNLG